MATFDVAQGGGVNTTTVVPSQPSTTAIGDLLLVTAMVDGSSSLTLAFSVGTIIRTIGSGQPSTYAAWWMTATAAGSRTLGTLSWDGVSRYNAWSVTRIPPGTFSFDTSTPIAASASQANASSTSMVFPAVSPAMSGCLSVLLGGIDNTASCTAPAGYTRQQDNTIGSFVATGDSPLSSGSSGTKTVTLSIARASGAIHVAIAPRVTAATLPLDPIASTSAPALRLTAPTRIALDPIVSTSAPALRLTAPTRLPLAGIASTSTVSMTLTTPSRAVLALDPIVSTSLVQLTVSTPIFRAISLRERPPLWLASVITPPSGFNAKRWAGDEPDPARAQHDLTISSSIPGGFDSMATVLARIASIEYGDLGPLSDVFVHGAGGRAAWNGRLTDAPKVSGDQMAITPDAQGYKAHLEDDNTASVIILDRDLTRWTGPGAQRQFVLMGASIPHQGDASAGWDTGVNAPALVLAIDGSWVSPVRPICEAWYDAGSANRIVEIAGTFAGVADANFTLQVATAGDAVAVAWAGLGDAYTAGSGSGSFDFLPTRRDRWGFLQWFYFATPAGVDGTTYAVKVTFLRVRGDHGLPIATGTDGFVGFYASDILRYALGRWAPKLRTTATSVQPSNYVIPQAAYYDLTNVLNILDDVTRYDLEDWAVWEDRVFYLYPRGTVGRSWRARIGPAKLRETGSSTQRLWNGVLVRYRDVDGTTRTVGPPGSGCDTEDGSLLDLDPANAANEAGILRYSPPLDMNIPSVPGAAIKVGARYLQECKALDRSGSAELVGTVYDDHGVEHPAWAVRAGDTISFVDASDTSLRRIVKASYSTSTLTTSIDLDAPPEGEDAILARLGLSIMGVS